ncbi:MAG: hypothetical protein J6C18_01330 [Bacteroidaceae bacterium]|nr:hypothetical protein [Bacteroidaceae bacterium]
MPTFWAIIITIISQIFWLKIFIFATIYIILLDFAPTIIGTIILRRVCANIT